MPSIIPDTQVKCNLHPLVLDIGKCDTTAHYTTADKTPMTSTPENNTVRSLLTLHQLELVTQHISLASSSCSSAFGVQNCSWTQTQGRAHTHCNYWWTSEGATFPRVLRHIHSKLNDVTRQDLTGGALLRAPAQTLAVDEGAIAALGVLQIELQQEERVTIREPRSHITMPTPVIWTPVYSRV